MSYKSITGYRRYGQVDMPMLSSRSTESRVQVSANRTIIFAGLLDHTSHQTTEKVPLLGDLPWIGGLFHRKIN